jgi:Na+-translocating ferredoxin:NAD+ oxidoreductase RnfD subunit
MSLKMNDAPYQRSPRTTFKIMMELSIALLIVWLAAVVTSFIKLGSGYGLKSILLMVVALAVTAGCDAINTVLTNKKDKNLLIVLKI